ncbi:vWA domain-containing protein [Dethiothermospora halolimnae]|uniref:vWA domain-containing protein n=1 Tax=Dethiothermospora halolimnae TaxID=3114390 RepID=UPI003CCC3BE6
MKKKFAALFLSIILILSFVTVISGNEVNYKLEKVKVMFVIDASNSINGNNKNMIKDITNLFITSLPNDYTELGFVAYNQDIISSMEPVPLNSRNNREFLTKEISKINMSGYSDLGKGLKEGLKLLSSTDSNEKSILILISDGGISTPKIKERDVDDSIKDVKKTVDLSKIKNIPIYTIRTHNRYDNRLRLDDIAAKTNGEFYEAKGYENYINIFKDIAMKYWSLGVEHIAKVVLEDESGDINIELKEDLAKSSKMLAISSAPNVKIEESNNIKVSKLNNYFYIDGVKKFTNNINVSFKGDKNAEINMYKLSYYDWNLTLDIPEKINKNQSFQIEGHFINNQDNKIINGKNFYNHIKSNIKFVDANNKIVLPTKVLNNKIHVDNIIHNSGNYKVHLNFKYKNINFNFDGTRFNIKNNPPKGKFKEKINVLFSKDKSYNLNNYFMDDDNDNLSYEIIDNDDNLAKIKENNLILFGNDIKSSTFKIKVTDSEGLSIITDSIEVSVMKFYQYYKREIIFFTILILLIMYILIKKKINDNSKKRTFTGSLKGYFISLKEEEDIPPFKVPLYKFEKKKLKLQEILKSSEIKKHYDFTENIYFKPSYDKKITLINKSNATVMINSDIAIKNKEYELEYKMKIHITFKDGITELELYYNKVN